MSESKGAEWHKFDYEKKAETAPPADTLVWIVEEFYVQGVTLGYFDGFTFRTWQGSDDCSIAAWAALQFPEMPDLGAAALQR